jgi:hypothetical protein
MPPAEPAEPGTDSTDDYPYAEENPAHSKVILRVGVILRANTPASHADLTMSIPVKGRAGIMGRESPRWDTRCRPTAGAPRAAGPSTRGVA